MVGEIVPISGDPRDAESQPPANVEAEQALLAAVLAKNDAYDAVAGLVTAADFSEAVHGRIFEVAGHLIQHGKIANAITLKNYFDEAEELAQVGGSDYLARLQGSVVSIINAGDFARTISDLAKRRALIAAAQDMITSAHDWELDVGADQLVDKADAALVEVRGEGPAGEGLRRAGDDGALDRIEEARRRRADGRTIGLSTGLERLDSLTAGLHPSDLVIIAGRPGMGKTALAAGIAHCVAAAGEHVNFFTREMRAEALTIRLLSARTGIDAERIRQGKTTDVELEEICCQRDELLRLPLYIHDGSEAGTVAGMRSAARRHQRKHGLALVVVDYLQLMTAPELSNRANRVEVVSAITRGLKLMAGDLGVPVIALSQLSRQNETREDKRPILPDLRESGSIEQDADVVIFIYRGELYVRRDEPREKKLGEEDIPFAKRRALWQGKLADVKGKAELILAKQREGPIGTAPVDFEPSTLRFLDEGAARPGALL